MKLAKARLMKIIKEETRSLVEKDGYIGGGGVRDELEDLVWDNYNYDVDAKTNAETILQFIASELPDLKGELDGEHGEGAMQQGVIDLVMDLQGDDYDSSLDDDWGPRGPSDLPPSDRIDFPGAKLIDPENKEQKVKNFLSTKAYTSAGMNPEERKQWAIRNIDNIDQFVFNGELYQSWGGYLFNSDDEEVDPSNLKQKIQFEEVKKIKLTKTRLMEIIKEEVIKEVSSEKQRRYMCAMKDKEADERPDGLSKAEAEEMCTGPMKEEELEEKENK